MGLTWGSWSWFKARGESGSSSRPSMWSEKQQMLTSKTYAQMAWNTFLYWFPWQKKYCDSTMILSGVIINYHSYTSWYNIYSIEWGNSMLHKMNIYIYGKQNILYIPLNNYNNGINILIYTIHILIFIIYIYIILYINNNIIGLSNRLFASIIQVCLQNICHPGCENPAKVIFCDLLFST